MGVRHLQLVLLEVLPHGIEAVAPLLGIVEEQAVHRRGVVVHLLGTILIVHLLGMLEVEVEVVLLLGVAPKGMGRLGVAIKEAVPHGVVLKAPMEEAQLGVVALPGERRVIIVAGEVDNLRVRVKV